MLDGIELKGRCCVVALGHRHRRRQAPARALGRLDRERHRRDHAAGQPRRARPGCRAGRAGRHRRRQGVAQGGPRRASASTRRCSAACATRNVMKTVTSAAEISLEDVAVFERSPSCSSSWESTGRPAGRGGARSRRPGAVIDEDWTPADEDGLAILVARLGGEAVACLEMMSGAAWVRDRLDRRRAGRADRRCAQGQGGRVAGGQDRQARRARAGRAGAPRSGAAGARADVRRPRAQGATRATHAHGSPADLGDEPRARRAQPVRRQARVRAAARSPTPSELLDRARRSRRSGVARSPRPSAIVADARPCA